ncbi:MAG: pyridoxal-5'-phosphate-dependent protein subunit beta, partial [Hyphomicrobiaceae bacterium]
MSLGLEQEIINRDVYARNLQHLRGANVSLPRISDLADPVTGFAGRAPALADTDPDAPDAGNLFRIHWHNGSDRAGLTDVPEHIVLGPELTGVAAKIIVALGNRFPMIHAHKVLAAYGCLVPRLLSGMFDAERHSAV